MKDYSFGNFLRELRERRGLSQYQLGALVGVSNKAVSKWENGTAKPKTPILFRLSEILGVTVDELLACRYHSSDTDRKGMFAMKKEIWNKVSAAFRERYGDRPPLAAVNRLESEKAELEPTDFIVYLDLLAKITKTAKASGHHVELHDGTGGFFTAYLLGATDLNPLPPHYFCPICRKVEFVPDAADGWDLPAKTCACGSQMQRDGHNFPFEAYRSFYRRIKLSVMVDSGFFSEAEQIIREYFAESPLVTFDAWGTDPKDSQKQLVFIVLPQEKQDFARSNPVISFEKYRYTFMEYPYIHLIPWDELDTYRKLEQETNTSFDRIPYLEDGCLEPFAACNTDGIPDFKLKYTQACFREYPPKTYNDLIRLGGMLVCTSYSQSYLQDNIAKPESPAFRDDIFLHIQSHMTALGYTETGFAYSVMRNAHRGIYGKNGMDDTTRQRLLAIGLSADDIEMLSDIRYLFIKFRSVLDVRNALILMWYKLHYPETFSELLLK